MKDGVEMEECCRFLGTSCLGGCTLAGRGEGVDRCSEQNGEDMRSWHAMMGI